MANAAPHTTKIQVRMPAVAAGSDATSAVCQSPFDGVVTDVKYAPDATITGVVTNNRTLSVVNKGQAGSGNTSVATNTYANGVNITNFVPTLIPLSGTPANLVVANNDCLAFASVHNGTGLADPGGLLTVTISRTAGL
jgi:hypothetical protein